MIAANLFTTILLLGLSTFALSDNQSTYEPSGESSGDVASTEAPNKDDVPKEVITYVQHIIVKEAPEKMNAQVEQHPTGECSKEQLTYRVGNIESSNPQHSGSPVFSLDPTSGYLTGYVDYERTPSLQITVDVITNCRAGSAPKAYRVLVNVTVLDINDNVPWIVFDQKPSSYKKYKSTNLMENTPAGYNLTGLYVTDSDRGVNGEFECLLLNHTDKFALVKVEGEEGEYVVKTRTIIDYEAREGPSNSNRFHLSIVCQDKGTPALQDKVQLAVTIQDVNDNSPIISIPMADENNIITVEEESSISVEMEVTDADSRHNAEYHCSFNHSSFFFGPKWRQYPGRGPRMHTRIKMDYETQNIYYIKVWCTDHGYPKRLHSEKTYTIIVLDGNEIAPKIAIFGMPEVDNARVNEDADIGTLVAYASVYDLDTKNLSSLECALSNSNFALTILPTTDMAYINIVVAKSLDFEERTSEYIQISCADNGKPRSLTGKAAIEIHVIDVNDNSPSIQLYSLSDEAVVKQDMPPGGVVAHLSVSDLDQLYGHTQCEILDENFALEEVKDDVKKRMRYDVRLVTRTALVHDGNGLVNLTLKCIDNAYPPRVTSKTLTIRVVD